jgi:hypothetical protein
MPHLANAAVKADIPFKPFRSRKFELWARVHHMLKRRNISPKVLRCPSRKRSAENPSLMQKDQILCVMVTGN